MAEVLRTYWAGALRRLQAEVDGLARVVEHNLTMGEENEAALSRMLTNLIPRRFGTGSGLLIDSEDHQSRQTDIVIYERTMDASLFAQTSQLLFPVEACYATIEVKTRLTKEDIPKIGDAVGRVRGLTSTRTHLDDTQHPLTCVFAYGAWAKPKTVFDEFHALEEAKRPDLILVCDAGLLAGRTDLLQWATDEPYAGGVAFVTTKATNGTTAVLEVETKDPHYVLDGVTYPTYTRTSFTQRYLCDSSRALLLFLEALLANVQQKVDLEPGFMRHYIGDSLREVVSTSDL